MAPKSGSALYGLEHAEQRDLDQVVERLALVGEALGAVQRQPAVVLDELVAQPAVAGGPVAPEPLRILVPVRRIGPRRLAPVRRARRGDDGSVESRAVRDICTGASAVVRGLVLSATRWRQRFTEIHRVASAPVDLGITGRRAAVAAASAGLGLGCARALLREGVHVAICGRDAERVAAAAGGLEADAERGHRVRPGGRRATVAGALRSWRTAAALGGVDILVTNAGGPRRARSPRPTSTPCAYPAGAQPAVDGGDVPGRGAGMAERGWGRVVAITSITVRQPAAMLILSNTARAERLRS